MKKRVLATAALLAVGLVVLSACSSKSGAITNVGVKDFANEIQQAGVTTLDVRTPGEYSQGHIQGAINIDVEAPTFDSNIAQLDKTKVYAVYCHSGNRSAVATADMAKQGFTHIFNLKNGVLDWVGQGMPLVAS